MLIFSLTRVIFHLHSGFRQILIEMHGVPRPDGDRNARWYQKPMDIDKDYFQDFLDNGYALYSRDPNGDLGLELSFIKLHPDFWDKSKNPPPAGSVM